MNKNQILGVTCKDLETLVKASNNSKQVMEDFTNRYDDYTYKIDIDHDDLSYEIYLFKKKELN